MGNRVNTTFNLVIIGLLGVIAYSQIETIQVNQLEKQHLQLQIELRKLELEQLRRSDAAP